MLSNLAFEVDFHLRGIVAKEQIVQSILVVGGRAPAALELVRLFHQAGYRVVMAESVSWHLSGQSNAIAKNYCLPWPSTHPREYLAELSRIIEFEKIDLVVPTCEEIYYIVEGRNQLPDECKILAPPWDLLHALHSKSEFVQRAAQWNLPVPTTELLTSREQLEQAFALGNELVFKPVYSRFASLAIVRPKSMEQLADVEPSLETPWVAQEYISGNQICSFSLAHEGRLLAHVTYPMNFTTGIGPTYGFEPMDQSAVLEWVTCLVRQEKLTGQVAFDFIERADGSVVAIECNPRSTSGLHLFRGRVDLAHAYVHPQQHTGEMLVPNSGRPAHHAVPLLLWALGYVRSWKELKRWARTFFWGRDVLLSLRDPLPLLFLGFNLAPMFARARRYGVSIDHATTMDIEWNGTSEISDTQTQRVSAKTN